MRSQVVSGEKDWRREGERVEGWVMGVERMVVVVVSRVGGGPDILRCLWSCRVRRWFW